MTGNAEAKPSCVLGRKSHSKINNSALFTRLPRSISLPTIHAGNGEDNMTKRPMYLQHVNVYVRNVERSKKWYEDLLGLHVYEYRPGWAAFLTADEEQSHEVALMHWARMRHCSQSVRWA